MEGGGSFLGRRLGPTPALPASRPEPKLQPDRASERGSRVGTPVDARRRRLPPASSPCPLAQARAAQDKGSGGSCPDRRAGATAATRSARRLRRLRRPRRSAGEARRPPLSAPPRRAGSAGSARHRAAGAGHCTPGGAARPSRGQNRRARLESSRRQRCHRAGDCFGGSGAFC